MKNKLVVKSSKIHGKGLFTSVDLRQGTLLGYCNAVPVTDISPYTLWVGDELYDVTCRLKYINHAADPNVIYYDDLSVFTLRDIKAGEELTHHYGDEWD